MSRQATIPDFRDNDLRSIATALRAVKQQLETLTGQRQGASKGAPAVYVQVMEPVTSRYDVIKVGDFWVNPEGPAGEKLKYYNGLYWEKT